MDVRNSNSLELSHGVLEDNSSSKTSPFSSLVTSRRGSFSGEDMSQGKENSQVRFDSATKLPTSRPSSDARQHNSLSGRLQEAGPSSGAPRSSHHSHLEPRSLSTSIPAIIRSPPDGIDSRGQSPVRWRTESSFTLGSDDDVELEDIAEVDEIPNEFTRAELRKVRSQKKANSQAQNLRLEMENNSNDLDKPDPDWDMSSSTPHHNMEMPFDPIDLNDRLENAPARQNDADEIEGHREGQQNTLNLAGVGTYIKYLLGRIWHVNGLNKDRKITSE
ncbi:hypothetical protein MMC34_001084 [Xylographa carneopallida]|nr:hypothetical protein [Xylographa carneopallida]